MAKLKSLTCLTNYWFDFCLLLSKAYLLIATSFQVHCLIELLCVFCSALCLQMHSCPSCQFGWSEVGLIIMVLAMSFPADCNCLSTLCVLSLIHPSFNPNYRLALFIIQGIPRPTSNFDWRKLQSFSSLVLSEGQVLTIQICLWLSSEHDGRVAFKHQCVTFWKHWGRASREVMKRL